ncbi:hypothetical protein [Micromonospora sp. NPDC007230]|uniref:hypothetical protein n=1 Tax=Micromonospora sp. NPDC007230 TaxID=3364237 RepID=UPI00368F4E62
MSALIHRADFETETRLWVPVLSVLEAEREHLLDWTIVRTMPRLTSDRWGAILYTEQAGFDTTPPQPEA